MVIESKTFEISVEEKERLVKFVVTERRKGLSFDQNWGGRSKKSPKRCGGFDQKLTPHWVFLIMEGK